MNRVKKKTYVSMSLENAESWNDKLIHGEDNMTVFKFIYDTQSIFILILLYSHTCNCKPGFYCIRVLCHTQVHVSNTQRVHVGGKEC